MGYMMRTSTFLSLATALVITGIGPQIVRSDEPPTWNKELAAKYLDERGKTWLQVNGALRGEGDTKTTCISCHTMVPYALARPMLRKLTGAGEPTEFEAKTLEQIRARVAAWDQIDSAKYRLF